MIKFCVGLVTFFLTFFSAAEELIESYDIRIHVDAKGKLVVKESIKVQSEGFQIKRGIFRSFPTRYKDKNGFNVVVDFEVVGVTRNGQNEPFNVDVNYDESIVYVGKEDVFIPSGIHLYEISYTTSRQLGFFDEFDELYFNAIGGQWDFEIQNASVHVIFPDSTVLLNPVVFSGYLGDSGCNCDVSINKNELFIQTNTSLYPQEYLTFAVAFQKGIIAPPSTQDQLVYFLRDNSSVFIGFFLLIVVLGYYYIAWRKVGKDPRKGTIIPLFEPPNNYSPAEISYIINMKYKDNILTASLVNMAIKGHIKIVNKGKVFSIHKLNDDLTKLTPEERLISSTLFPLVSLFVFTNKNAKRLQSLESSLTSRLAKKKMPKYFLYNSKENMIGILMSIVAVVFFAFFAGHPLFILVFVGLLLFSMILFSYLLKAPTKVGRLVMDEIEGFKMYLTTAEQRFLDQQHVPELNVERFEKLLPYAIALDVENKWAKQFEAHLSSSKSGSSATEYSPSWYNHTGGLFRPAMLTAAVASSFSSAIATSSIAPGSSSGSSGGGFSGGGGGGGGGGGW
jgi:uncharacterized membrane protein